MNYLKIFKETLKHSKANHQHFTHPYPKDIRVLQSLMRFNFCPFDRVLHFLQVCCRVPFCNGCSLWLSTLRSDRSHGLGHGTIRGSPNFVFLTLQFSRFSGFHFDLHFLLSFDIFGQLTIEFRFGS